MFKSLSIHKKMNYFVAMVTVSVFSAAISIFLALGHIESKYDHLHQNSMTSALTTLDIEKNLNFISRLSRDIMLGGSYDKNIANLSDTIESIRKSFDSLEALMAKDQSLEIVVEAKNSTMLFLNNSLTMMKSLDP